MIFRSIRWRLQAWHGLLLVVVLTGFGFTAYHLTRENQLRRVDQELNQRLMGVLRPRPPRPRPEGPPELDNEREPPDLPERRPPEHRPDGPDLFNQVREAIRQTRTAELTQTNA